MQDMGALSWKMTIWTMGTAQTIGYHASLLTLQGQLNSGQDLQTTRLLGSLWNNQTLALPQKDFLSVNKHPAIKRTRAS